MGHGRPRQGLEGGCDRLDGAMQLCGRCSWTQSSWTLSEANDQFLPLERHYGMSGYAVVCTFVYLVSRRMFQKFSEHTFQALESLDPTFPAVHQRQQEMLAGLPSAFGTRWLAVLQRGWHNSIGLYSVV